ncbi:MAG: hypothetical protein Q9170_003042 [Blastenia crenularia]
MKDCRLDRLLWLIILGFSLAPLGNAMQHMLPTPTFAGLRAAQADLGLKPTPPPDYSSELLKRLNGDPAVCGWVEGSEIVMVESLIAPPTGMAKVRLKDTDVQQSPVMIRLFLPRRLLGSPLLAKALQQVHLRTQCLQQVPYPGQQYSPGGAIAGTVAGSILVLAGIVSIILFFWRRHRTKKEQERQAASVTSQRTQSYVYADYAKPPAPSTLSPPMSPPMHSRQPSEQGYGFASSPPMSDNGRLWSPETINPQDGPVELEAGRENRSMQKY